MTEGTKYDGGKPPMGLLPRHSLEQVAEVLAFGAQRYGAHNWRKGIEVQRQINASLRHIFKANEGEDTDPDSGLPHLAHAICDLMFALNTIHDRPEMDDRYKPEPRKSKLPDLYKIMSPHSPLPPPSL